MKISHILAALAVPFLPLSAQAEIVLSGYGESVYIQSTYLTYTSDYADNPGIVSFDFTSGGDLYFTAQDYDYWVFDGLHKRAGSGSVIAVDAGDWVTTSGPSVVALGNNVYFGTDNWVTQPIYRYNTSGGSLSLALETALYTQLYNFAPNATRDGLFILNGSQLLFSTVAGDGSLGAPSSIGNLGNGASGPIALSARGDLYFAPGYMDNNIYHWSAATLAAALSGGAPLSLENGNIFANYAGIESLDMGSGLSGYGGTSMLFDAEGHLLLSLTSYGDVSELVQFTLTGDGSFFSGSEEDVQVLLYSDGRLGEIRLWNGDLFVAEENSIYRFVNAQVPEPTTWVALLTGLGAMALLRTRRVARPTP